MPPKPKSVRVNQPQQLIPLEIIERRIFLIRAQKVMLDSDLAKLYQVPTFRLNEAVKRNRDRFPEDFMLRLSKEEADALTSQFAISKTGRGGRRTLPYAFSEHGVAMLSPFTCLQPAENAIILKRDNGDRQRRKHEEDFAGQ